MGESAALQTENLQASPSTNEETVVVQQTEFDNAIKELSGVAATATSPAIGESTQQADPSAPIWDIPVDVNIVMGSAELTVARLMELENGDVVELNRRVGEPLDIAVNGQNIAKGTIVMNENDESQFAIQITELVGR